MKYLVSPVNVKSKNEGQWSLVYHVILKLLFLNVKNFCSIAYKLVSRKVFLHDLYDLHDMDILVSRQ